ncbi:hypothetical protein QWA68_015809 [Fusarium oxysporum]|nr:hypothetical protein QWA68_015809 [Fusarium oxysporum]
MNNRFDKLESFATNTKARAKNARARELGVPDIPLVKGDGSAIRKFLAPLRPSMHLTVCSLSCAHISSLASLAGPRLSTLLLAIGVELEDDWTVEQKRSAFLDAIGVMQLPTL